MNTLEGKSWHALSGAKGAGSKTLWLIADYLANKKKTASWLLQNPDKIQDVIYGSKASIVMPDFVEQKYAEVAKSEGQPITVLHPLHPDFPQRIRALKDVMPLPAILYVKGNMAILNRPAIAMVGKRNAGATALAVADSLACELVAKGITIISGYAAGIDSAAHLAALRAGGTTDVILSEGISRFQIKPELRAFLTTENTLVISQFEPDAKWAAFMAMTRNKLVAALSDAVLVIVSGPERDANGRNSGTFNTGISALEMGVPIFVASPDFFPDNSEGNRQLIAKGCRKWDPASGTDFIFAALESHAAKNMLLRQRKLFPEK